MATTTPQPARDGYGLSKSARNQAAAVKQAAAVARAEQPLSPKKPYPMVPFSPAFFGL